jgi:hypothetical protein
MQSSDEAPPTSVIAAVGEVNAPPSHRATEESHRLDRCVRVGNVSRVSSTVMPGLSEQGAEPTRADELIASTQAAIAAAEEQMGNATPALGELVSARLRLDAAGRELRRLMQQRR